MCSRIDCLSESYFSETCKPEMNSKGTILFTYLLELIATAFKDGSRELKRLIRNCKFTLLDDLKVIIRTIIMTREMKDMESVLQEIKVYCYNIDLFLQILGIKNKKFTDKIVRWKLKLNSIVESRDKYKVMERLDELHTMMYFILDDVVNSYHKKVSYNIYNGVEEDNKIIDLNTILGISMYPKQQEYTKDNEKIEPPISNESTNRPRRTSWFFGLFRMCGL